MRASLRFLTEKTAYYSGLVNYINREKTGFMVLMYHSIPFNADESLYPYSVNSDDFEKHINYIKNNFKVVRLSEVVSAMTKKTANSGLKIAITFDDGYKNNFTAAYPILLRYGIPATIFLTTSYIEQRSETFLNWPDIKHMEQSGLIEFGVHAHRHLDLTSLASSDIKNEISISKLIIGQNLGKAINYFSYPFGSVNDETKRILSDHGFKAAFIDRVRGKGRDIYEIGRLSVDSARSGLSSFAFKIAFSESCM